MKTTNETEKIISEQLSTLNKIDNVENLEEWRVNTLGRQGVITSILKSISSLPIENRKPAGSAANQGKIRLQDAFDIKLKQLSANDSSNSVSNIASAGLASRRLAVQQKGRCIFSLQPVSSSRKR